MLVILFVSLPRPRIFYKSSLEENHRAIKCKSLWPDCGSTARHETTALENSTFSLLIALDKEAQFLYPKIDPYRSVAEKANRSDLVNMWNTIKHDRQRHMQMLRGSLKQEAEEERLRK